MSIHHLRDSIPGIVNPQFFLPWKVSGLTVYFRYSLPQAWKCIFHWKPNNNNNTHTRVITIITICGAVTLLTIRLINLWNVTVIPQQTDWLSGLIFSDLGFSQRLADEYFLHNKLTIDAFLFAQKIHGIIWIDPNKHPGFLCGLVLTRWHEWQLQQWVHSFCPQWKDKFKYIFRLFTENCRWQPQR